jgi:hypothetical protein
MVMLVGLRKWGAGAMRIAAGAGLGSLFSAYYLHGEFKRCQLLVQTRLDSLSKLLDH